MKRIVALGMTLAIAAAFMAPVQAAKKGKPTTVYLHGTEMLG